MKTINEDLLSGTFTRDVNKNQVKKYIRLATICFILFAFYVILNFVSWFWAIQKLAMLKQSLFATLQYKIQAILLVVEAAITAFAFYNLLRGQRSILVALEIENAEAFNKGYKWLNSAMIANLIGYAMLVVSLAYRMFIFNGSLSTK